MRTTTSPHIVRGALVAGLAVAALALLASCGTDDQDTDTGQAGDSADELFDVQPLQIDEATLVDDTTIQIVVSIGVEPCHVIDEISVDETDSMVTVTVTAGSADPDAACIEIVEIKELDVQLEQAMGDRTLIDGATGEEITMNGSDDPADPDDSDDSAAPTTAPSADSTSSSTSEPPASSTTTEGSTISPPTTQEDAPGGLIGVRTHRLDGMSVVDDTTILLLMTGDPAPCFLVDRVEKVETDSSVELTVYVGSEPDVACIAIIEEHSTTVTLDQPLGDRTVIDGSNGREL